MTMLLRLIQRLNCGSVTRLHSLNDPTVSLRKKRRNHIKIYLLKLNVIPMLPSAFGVIGILASSITIVFIHDDRSYTLVSYWTADCRQWAIVMICRSSRAWTSTIKDVLSSHATLPGQLGIDWIVNRTTITCSLSCVRLLTYHCRETTVLAIAHKILRWSDLFRVWLTQFSSNGKLSCVYAELLLCYKLYYWLKQRIYI